MNLLSVFAATAAGVAAALQAAANAGLAARIGLGAALVLSTTVVLIGALGFLVATGQRASFFPEGTPWSLYIGGVCGFVIIFGSAFAFPRIGAARAIALVVLGQGAAALAIDHYGLLGIARQPLSLSRLGGFALIVAGVVLLRR